MGWGLLREGDSKQQLQLAHPPPTLPLHTLHTHLLGLLAGVVVHAAHAEGVLVGALHRGAVGPHQAVHAVRQLQLQLGAGGLHCVHMEGGEEEEMVRQEARAGVWLWM